MSTVFLVPKPRLGKASASHSGESRNPLLQKVTGMIIAFHLLSENGSR